jgi:tRNA(Ile)-lysidine synthase
MMDEIYNRFRNFVFEKNLIIPGEKILLSLSAGKDSMFMLHLVKKLQNESAFEIGIFHLNHLTRGEETDKDEIFIRKISSEFDIPCYIERYDFKADKQNDVSFEEHARNIRYSLLKKISHAEGYTKIATAHNLDDNAETVLMRILSGTGIAGLKGILPVTGNIIRPVLFARKDEIYSCLRDGNIEWREDLSNNDNLYLRNYLRNVVIPDVKARFPLADENLCNLSDHAVESQALLGRLTDKLYPGAVTKNLSETIIDVNDFTYDIPLIKFLISKVLSEEYGVKLKISIYDEIIRRFIINSSNMVLYKIDDLVIRKGLINGMVVIYINDINDNSENTGAWEYAVSPEENISAYLKEIKKEVRVSYVDYDFYNTNKNKSDMVFIQPDHELNKIIIRNRRPGDRIKIESGTKKIKEFMIEKKLDSRTKNTIPLIMADDCVAAYLPGLINTNNNRVACNFHIRNDTKRILAFFFRDY